MYWFVAAVLCAPPSDPGVLPDMTIVAMVMHQFWLAQVDLSFLTPASIVLRLLSIVVLILINSFFVTAEFSIVSVRRSRIRQLVLEGDDQARAVQNFQRSLDRLLSTTQFGITLSSLALGWIGERTMAVLLSKVLWSLPLPLPFREVLVNSIAIPVAFFLLAYLQIIFGELCPKALTLVYPEQLARFFGPLSLVIAQIFHPFIWVLNQSTHFILRLFGIRYSGQSWYDRVTPEELQLIISTSSESSGLEAEERQLLNNVFEFGEVTAGDVMVPRTQIIALSRDASLQTLLEEVATSGHSLYPVIGESVDDVRGIIQFKELADPLAKGQLIAENSIETWTHPARFVPEYLPLSELLPLMQRSGRSMMIVVDEYGGTAGLVTLKDIVEEIIGEIPDISDEDEPKIKTLDAQTVVVQAQLDLDEVNELLNLELPLADDYNTLGGFLIYQLQKIPTQGEILRYGSLEFTVISAEGPRLHYIQIHWSDPKTPEGLEIVTTEL